MTTVEDRLAAIEARIGIGPSPLALVPPITIGELTNVPAPGSQIAAAWAQDVSSRVVQRFPTTAALKAWGAPGGSFAVALDTGVLWQRIATGWTQVTPWQMTVAGSGLSYGLSPATYPVATINIPADPGPRSVFASCLLRVDKIQISSSMFVQLTVSGVAVGQTDIPPEKDSGTGQANLAHTYYAPMSGVYDLPTNVVVPVVLQVVATQPAFETNWTVPSGAYYNRLDVVVAPRGR